ncbi:hypothetical protein [Flavobacterium chungbukense]|uniref:Bacteriocin n=1 Tax=Flavobacterium chungbukense TaxID=877464 RepID=A0ABP7YLT8_9FLAO|nr:hypothetical protein [Flavobacterium chungbukense]MCC4919896.1 hypothetical protein [Flavobacterium chungbukense]
MKIENLNLAELNARELQEIEGGYWWVIAEVAYELMYAQDDVKKGYNAAKNLFK